MDADEIKRIRIKLGLTQADAAEALGLASATVISNIETGFREPSRLTSAILLILDELPQKEAQLMIERLVKKQKSLHSKQVKSRGRANGDVAQGEQRSNGYE